MSEARDLNPLQSTNPVISGRASESRLLEIRREAEMKGRVIAPGVRLPGAPFPIASPETGYYGVPLLKKPQWSWEIPVYFFVGGAASSAAVIGTVARLTGRDRKIACDSRYVAAIGTALSTGLLISDLGRPKRFLAMLRVMKFQSPMSVGAWVVAVFGTFSGGAAIAQILQDVYGFGWAPIRWAGNIAEVVSALFALPFSNYTGVLLGATVIPVWNHNIKTLPIHFGMSGLNSGVSILELLGNEDSGALNSLGIGASALETYEGYDLERVRDPEINRPLKSGVSGWITRAGGVLSGPVPLALRIGSMFVSPRKSRTMRRWAAWSSIAGSMLTRIGWIRAGHASAKDWRVPLRDKSVKLDDESMQSIGEYPRMKAAG